MIEEYYVKKVETGYVICKTNRTIPLPFNYSSRQYAVQDCAEFNKYGSIAVASAYYTYKIAGNCTLNDYKYARDKWLVDNYANFDW